MYQLLHSDELPGPFYSKIWRKSGIYLHVPSNCWLFRHVSYYEFLCTACRRCRRYGDRLYRCPTYMPHVNLHGLRYVFVLLVQVHQLTFTFCGTGSLQVVLVENVPENGPMGTVNGIAQMLGSGMRSIAPTFASSLFSISLQRGLAGGNMVYYILLAMTFVSSRLSLMLPKHVKAKRRST